MATNNPCFPPDVRYSANTEANIGLVFYTRVMARLVSIVGVPSSGLALSGCGPMQSLGFVITSNTHFSQPIKYLEIFVYVESGIGILRHFVIMVD